MCQPRLAVTRFNVPAKCHFGCLWNQRTIETLPHKDYLINRIISPSILSQLCDNVKREQENNQSIFVMKLCHPPSVACSRLNRNEKWRYVYFFVQRRRVWSWFRVFSSLCFWIFIFFCSNRLCWLAVPSVTARLHYLERAAEHICTGFIHRYASWTQIASHNLNPDS